MAAAHAVVRLGLLHMRNFQRWFSRLRLHPSQDGGRLIWVPQIAASDIRFWLTPGLLRDGVTLACAVSLRRVHGRVTRGLGRGPRSELCRRLLVGLSPPHQPAGDGGSTQGTAALFSSAAGETRDGSLKQHHGGVLSEQAVGHQIPRSPSHGNGDAAVGGASPSVPEGVPRPGCPERGGRQDVQGGPTPGQVWPGPTDSCRGLAEIRSSSGRPFRQCRERTVPVLVRLKGRGRTALRGGRSGSLPLARGPAVCVSASSSPASPAAEDRTGGEVGEPFEPVAEASPECVAFKTALLLALASAKRAGDLCALSVHASCLSLETVTVWWSCGPIRLFSLRSSLRPSGRE
uniref:Uncharacterized protein n=1 Tax=Knipowitschia caucasica TaxID=637954 RepID=A0AAV2L8B4_KNICA